MRYYSECNAIYVLFHVPATTTWCSEQRAKLAVLMLWRIWELVLLLQAPLWLSYCYGTTSTKLSTRDPIQQQSFSQFWREFHTWRQFHTQQILKQFHTQQVSYTASFEDNFILGKFEDNFILVKFKDNFILGKWPSCFQYV